jgi:hypothetical protein
MKQKIILLILLAFGINNWATAQKHVYWGIQISPLATANQKNDSPLNEDNIGKGISGGLLFDWLVHGDFGSIRLESNYLNYSLVGQTNLNERLEKNIQVLDLPISYRLTHLFSSNFNIFFGSGVQIVLNESLKENFYIQYGFDYYFYTERIKNPYFVGLSLKQGLIDQAKVKDYSIHPFMLQLIIGKTFPLSSRK